MGTNKSWSEASTHYYDAERSGKKAGEKAKSLSGERGRADHGIGYYSNPEMEASRKKRLQMADEEVDVQKERQDRAKKEMDEISRRPPMSKKWVEK